MKESPIKAITDFIFVCDPPVKSDAIFVAGGSNPALPEMAAKLFSAGLSPFIFIGGAYSIKEGKFPGPSEKADIYNGDYKTECEFYADVLEKNGVPASAVIGEARSRYTKENAVFAKKLVCERGTETERALLVCQAFHARRCLMYYQLAFPDTQFTVCPVATMGIDTDSWYLSREGRELVFGEMRKIGEQFPDEIAESIDNA